MIKIIENDQNWSNKKNNILDTDIKSLVNVSNK